MMKIRGVLRCAVWVVFLVCCQPLSSWGGEPEKKITVTDMAGRTVVIPLRIDRIATIGPVPVINSYLFTLGAGGKIVNGLPHFALTRKWRVQTVLAPHLTGQPVLQGPSREVNMEVLLKLSPDVIITMTPWNVKAFEDRGIPILFLEWKNTSDIKANMKLLGSVLNRTSRSDAYLRYFENTINRVRQGLKDVPEKSRPKVLYFDPSTLTTPLVIADWWIEEGGGRSVTAGISRSGNVRYSHEQVLLWNPDIMIVPSQEQIKAVCRDRRLAKTGAVLNKRVYAIPVGAHPWSHRTAEQPLTVLWAAKTFFPGRFRQVSMEREVQTFYRRFFDHELSDEDTRKILTGDAG